MSALRVSTLPVSDWRPTYSRPAADLQQSDGGCWMGATGLAERVWKAGCASGEEAYSMAMLIHDLLLSHQHPLRVQIFATDIDEMALVRARRGPRSA